MFRYFLVLFSLFCSLYAKVIEPTYAYINISDFNHAGDHHQEAKVCDFIKLLDAKLVVEIGSSYGESACSIAKTIPSNGALICIDEWLGSEEQRLSQEEAFLEDLYPLFLSNALKKGYPKRILPLRMGSLEAANMLKIEPDIIYFDPREGTHILYASLSAWWPKLKEGGIFCGSAGHLDTVSKALERFAEERALKIHVMNHEFWYLTPKNRKEGAPLSKIKSPSQPPLTLYSLIKDLPFQEKSDERLTQELISLMKEKHLFELIAIEPRNTLSISKLGNHIRNKGKLFLIEYYETIRNNAKPAYAIHPFHQRLSNIAHENLNQSVIPITMSSMQGAKHLKITAPLIFLNFSNCYDILTQLESWKTHLTKGGILCGNLADDYFVLGELQTFARKTMMSCEIKESGFWIMR